MKFPENRLPKHLLDKATKSTNEFGWKQIDIIEVIEAAREISMATIGGQIQYFLPGATCELYWLKYDSAERLLNEDWLTYCNRTANECIGKIKYLIENTDIQKDAIESFPILEDNIKSGIKVNDFLTFIIYFDDQETDAYFRSLS